MRLIVGDIFVEWLQLVCGSIAGRVTGNEREPRVGARRDADHRNFLQIGTIVARRFQSIERKLRGDVLRGNVASALAGAASFEKIVRKKPDMGLDVVGTNALHGVDGHRRKMRAEAGFGARFYRLVLRAKRKSKSSGQQRDDERNSPTQHAGHLNKTSGGR